MTKKGHWNFCLENHNRKFLFKIVHFSDEIENFCDRILSRPPWTSKQIDAAAEDIRLLCSVNLRLIFPLTGCGQATQLSWLEGAVGTEISNQMSPLSGVLNLNLTIGSPAR